MAKTVLRQGKFDIVYTRACSHVSNVIGLAVKNSSQLPWIAHFSDPWVDSPFFPKNRRAQYTGFRLLEQAIIHRADSIVFTASQAAELVMSKYPSEWKSKVHVIPHGYDSNAWAPMPSEGPRKAHKRLRLIHTGSLYSTRNPYTLFQALQMLNERKPLHDLLHVIFIGPILDEYSEAAKRMSLDSFIEFRGQMPFSKTLEEASQADAMLVIDAPSETPSVFLPGKLIDYLAFRKPILAITPLQGGSADLLKKLGNPIVEPTDVQGIADIITEYLERWQRGELTVSERFQQVASEYDIRMTTRELSDVMENTAEEFASRERLIQSRIRRVSKHLLRERPTPMQLWGHVARQYETRYREYIKPRFQTYPQRES
jgi:glycosyltransferase involved in cell wall biosynthesis